VKVRYTAEAIACIALIGRHHRPSNLEAASNIRSDVQATTRRISLDPLIYARLGRTDVRRAVTRRYRYLIYFRLIEESFIAILSVRHGAERPRFNDEDG
jgi:plasmid stabilization system protein ParE